MRSNIGSDNLGGAGNQQERLSSREQRRWFLAGVIEGEGSWCVRIAAHPTTWSGLFVQPAFFVYQHEARRALLELAMEELRCGRISPKPGNPSVLVYAVHARRALVDQVVPFLQNYMSFSARRADLVRFMLVLDLLEDGAHRTPDGLAAIVELAYAMSFNGKQRRTPLRDMLGRIPRGHTPDALAARRDGPTSAATRRARRKQVTTWPPSDGE
jgi:hypothetical protein